MAVLWPPCWISCLYRCRALAVIAPLRSPHSRPSILPLESCRYLNFWQSYKYFRFMSVLWPPSWISYWCRCRALAVIASLCSPHSRPSISPLESCRYLNFWQSYKYFRFMAVLWPPSWISCWYRCRALAVIAPLCSPHSRHRSRR